MALAGEIQFRHAVGNAMVADIEDLDQEFENEILMGYGGNILDLQKMGRQVLEPEPFVKQSPSMLAQHELLADDCIVKPSQLAPDVFDLSLPDEGFCRQETEQCWPDWVSSGASPMGMTMTPQGEARSGGIAEPAVSPEAGGPNENITQDASQPVFQYMWLLGGNENPKLVAGANGYPCLPQEDARNPRRRLRRRKVPSLIDMAAKDQRQRQRQEDPQVKATTFAATASTATRPNARDQAEGDCGGTSKQFGGKFCPFCGGTTVPQSKFCTFCGADLLAVRHSNFQ